MKTDRELMQQALDDLMSCSGAPHWPVFQPTITALRERLAQLEQEPVAWVNHGENRITRATGWDGYGALYTHPTRREWRGLTEEDEIPWDGVDVKSFAKAIEAALKEKNQ